ncbi:hypothetical protein GXW78_16860 [Roseomonas terrae]|uniref:Uncharacterized protein n=1 Tax=Neoroseomonas terrae TaxID=424799 RepID=A0ABS5EJZ7_9PROT|nr:hypothetical protein [Neoroseomonas terrae]MBR0651346.1 hypothetical protein [Neoroseomonas terrae]
MAFDIKGFQPAGGESKSGAAPKMHTYKSEDAITVVRVAGYFNPVRHMLEIGDLIYVVATSAGALSTASWVVVKDKSASAVDVTDQTAITVTDTD